MICGERSIVNADRDSGIAISLECRAWNCLHCRPKRRRQLISLAVQGCPSRLITLTTNPSVGVSPAARAHLLANAWRLVVKRAKRAFGWKSLEYLAVFEATKRGEPHLHILARCGFIPQRWLSAQMRDIMQAPIVDIREVKNTRTVAGYVAKYIGKNPHRFATCKRYWHTQGWVSGSDDKEERAPWGTARWEIVDDTLVELRNRWCGMRRVVYELTPGVIFFGTPPPGVSLDGLEPLSHTFH